MNRLKYVEHHPVRVARVTFGRSPGWYVAGDEEEGETVPFLVAIDDLDDGRFGVGYILSAEAETGEFFADEWFLTLEEAEETAEFVYGVSGAQWTAA